jgi:hypothetical protein
MKKVEKAKLAKKSKQDEPFPLARENYIILGVGVLVIVVGYIALSGSSVEGFMPLTLAPILLVLGYCVIIPVGILYRKKAKPPEEHGPGATIPQVPQ